MWLCHQWLAISLLMDVCWGDRQIPQRVPTALTDGSVCRIKLHSFGSFDVASSNEQGKQKSEAEENNIPVMMLQTDAGVHQGTSTPMPKSSVEISLNDSLLNASRLKLEQPERIEHQHHEDSERDSMQGNGTDGNASDATNAKGGKEMAVERMDSIETLAYNTDLSKCRYASDVGMQDTPACRRCHFWQACLVPPESQKPFCKNKELVMICSFCVYILFIVALWFGIRKTSVLSDLPLLANEELTDEELDLVENARKLQTKREQIHWEMASLKLQIDGLAEETKISKERMEAGATNEDSQAPVLFRGATTDETQMDSLDECSLEERMNAGAGAIFAATIPYVHLGVKTGNILETRKNNLVKSTTSYVEDELGNVLEESAGLPKDILKKIRQKAAQGGEEIDLEEEIDWFPLILLLAGLCAPLQLQGLQCGQCLAVVFRLSYCVTAFAVCCVQWNLPCTHDLVNSNPVFIRDWILIDIAFQVVLVICAVPVIQLTNKANKEVLSYAIQPTNIDNTDPVQYFKEILLYDSKYGGLAVLRHDQVTSSKAVKWARWILYANLVWLFTGFDEVLVDTPYDVCAARWILLLARGRTVTFMMTAGIELCGVLINVLQQLMETESFFHSVIKTSKDFDRTYIPGGLPLVEMMAKTFVLRDMSDPFKANRSSLERELNECRGEISQVDQVQTSMQSELQDIDHKLQELESHLAPSLQRERGLQDKYLQSIHDRERKMEEQAMDAAEQAMDKVEQTFQSSDLAQQAVDAVEQARNTAE
eukprot:gnl/MRDRNA2_/MRDRNA2_81624_c0_seq2.p1 gnl/MRDRNA2_/MRDRNA2_81624_c0~~gnl/MRDRNA2_/MRDRNA2_81624_c0_seq2.p1  ORF type:complete len:768 (+),score=131.93 gnl/MRDRNA2_/MRDRNA2_81624_c0_seq2:93-2396(+)